MRLYGLDCPCNKSVSDEISVNCCEKDKKKLLGKSHLTFQQLLHSGVQFPKSSYLGHVGLAEESRRLFQVDCDAALFASAILEVGEETGDDSLDCLESSASLGLLERDREIGCIPSGCELDLGCETLDLRG